MGNQESELYMWDPYAGFKKTTLVNGLDVHVFHWPERPYETVGFLIHSGAEQDPPGREGLIHFVEHMVGFNAATPFKDMRAFFWNHGGQVYMGGTSNKAVLYNFFLPARESLLETAFSLFGQMLLGNTLENFMERERNIILGEFNQHHKHRFNFDVIARGYAQVFKGYWLERSFQSLGVPETIRAISHEDVRRHYQTHFTPANMSIVAVGGMEPAVLLKLISQSPFALAKEGMRTPFPRRVAEMSPPGEARYVFEYSKHEVAPSENASYQTFCAIPGNVHVALRVFATMLAEVLYEEIRERREWTYDIHPFVSNLRYFHEFGIKCKSLSVAGLDGIESAVESCIISLAQREDLFLRKQKQAVEHWSMLDIDARTIRQDAMDDLIDHDRIVTVSELEHRYRVLNMGDILGLIPKLTVDRRWTLIKRP